MKKAIRRRGVPQEILSQLQLPLSELIRQTLLDTVITSGTIQAIEMLRSQQEALCGPRYKQVADRKAHRHGSTAGSLVMGGRRVTLPRPRVRSVAGREVELPAWTQWSREDPLEQRALQQMILRAAVLPEIRRGGKVLDPESLLRHENRHDERLTGLPRRNTPRRSG